MQVRQKGPEFWDNVIRKSIIPRHHLYRKRRRVGEPFRTWGAFQKENRYIETRSLDQKIPKVVRCGCNEREGESNSPRTVVGPFAKVLVNQDDVYCINTDMVHVLTVPLPK